MVAPHEDSVVSEQCVWSLTKLLLWPLDKLSFTSNVQDFMHQFLKIKDQLYKIWPCHTILSSYWPVISQARCKKFKFLLHPSMTSGHQAQFTSRNLVACTTSYQVNQVKNSKGWTAMYTMGIKPKLKAVWLISQVY